MRRPSFARGYARSRGASAYPGLWDGLEAYYAPSLGPQNAATLLDVSGRGRHATLNFTGSPIQWDATERGWAIRQDGADTYAQLPNSVRTGQVFTISAWWCKNTDGLNYPLIVGSDAYAGVPNSGGVAIYLTGTADQLRFEILASAASRQSLLGRDYTGDRKWHHLAAVSNGSTLSLYEDGQLTASATKTVTINWGSLGFYIAKQGTGNPGSAAGAWFDGLDGDVGIYSRAWSAAEALSVYRGASPLSPHPRVFGKATVSLARHFLHYARMRA